MYGIYSPAERNENGGGIMSNYLFLYTIGPVQSFIAQARKTQDLWCGSTLLSELSRETALHAQKKYNAKLV